MPKSKERAGLPSAHLEFQGPCNLPSAGWKFTRNEKHLGIKCLDAHMLFAWAQKLCARLVLRFHKGNFRVLKKWGYKLAWKSLIALEVAQSRGKPEINIGFHHKALFFLD